MCILLDLVPHLALSPGRFIRILRLHLLRDIPIEFVKDLVATVFLLDLLFHGGA